MSTYHTDNIAVAAGLRLNGFVIEKVEINGKKATFIFSDLAAQTAHELTMGMKLVDAILFHNELRRLSGLARSMVSVKD